MLFVNNLKIVKKYPGMYLPTNTLVEATSFVAGMDMMHEEPIGNEFREWLLSNKLECESSFYWPKLVELYMSMSKVEPENQVVTFLDLLFEFLEKTNRNSVNE